MNTSKQKKNNSYYTLKILLLFLITSGILYLYNPLFKDYLFTFIEKNILYREIPPVYNNSTFKETEPNEVCSYLNNFNLNTNSYSRSQYFDFSCESNSLVSSDTSYSVKYLATGKVFNIDTIMLHINFINPEKKEVALKDSFIYLDELIKTTSNTDIPLILENAFFNKTNFEMHIKKDIHIRLVFTENDLSIYLN